MTDAKYTPRDADYIRVQGNKQYLPVPNRVQWFRGDHPTWTIDTDVIRLEWEDGYVVMRAEVRNDEGRVIAAGTKTETRKGFADFVEKAETGAVGRALARAGYGTEDALDLEGDRLADAPISQPERVRGGSPSSPDASAPVPRTPEEQELLDELLAVPGMTKARLSLLADAVGVPKGERANADQLREMLARTIETPQSEVSPDSSGSDAATAQAPVSPPGGEPAPAPTDAEILAVTGGEMVKSRTVEEAIADAEAKAKKSKAKVSA